LGIDNSDIDINPLLQSGKISLYLDGYNEVSVNRELRTKVCKEIINLSKTETYENLCMIVSDRTDDTEPKYWYKNIGIEPICFELISLKDNEIFPYFKTKFQGEKNQKYLDRVKKALEIEKGGLKWLYGEWAVPLVLEKVKKLVMIYVDDSQEQAEIIFPGKDDFDFAYIEAVLEREESQKIEVEDFEEMERLRIWLNYIANVSNEEPLVIAVETALKNMPQYSYEICKKLYDKALEIPIIKMTEDNTGVEFVNPSYRTFCSIRIDERGKIRQEG